MARWQLPLAVALLPGILGGCSGAADRSIAYDLDQSDLVVEGTLLSVEVLTDHRAADWGGPPDSMSKARWISGNASLLVSDVIWGDVSTGQTLTVSWTRALGTNTFDPEDHHAFEEPPDTDYELLVGKRRIWALSGDESSGLDVQGLYEDSGRDVVERVLREHPMRIISRSDLHPGGSVPVVVQFRNASTREMTLPAFSMDGGGLVHGSGASFTLLEMQAGGDIEVSPATPGAIRLDSDLQSVVLEPGDHLDVPLDLSRLYEFEECTGYWFEVHASSIDEPGSTVLAIGSAGGDHAACFDE